MTSTAIVAGGVETRILREGYGEGAWHGPDLKAALADVDEALAFWRPGKDRHSIAEIAIHHAYCAHAVRAKLGNGPIEPFVLDGEDWFELTPNGALTWRKVLDVVETEQQRLAECFAGPGSAERLELALGITCHAVYHAGQIQLIKRLRE